MSIRITLILNAALSSVTRSMRLRNKEVLALEQSSDPLEEVMPSLAGDKLLMNRRRSAQKLPSP